MTHPSDPRSTSPSLRAARAAALALVGGLMFLGVDACAQPGESKGAETKEPDKKPADKPEADADKKPETPETETPPKPEPPDVESPPPT